MSNNKVSVKGIAAQALKDDNKAREKAGVPTADSFQNFQMKMGIGTGNPTDGGTYGYNPISRNHTLLEWIYRGSWLGGVAIDIVANDMTRAGVELLGGLKPEKIEELQEAVVRMALWDQVRDTFAWGRLYGGCICVMMVDGQQMHTPLRLETIGKGQFKGMYTLDRWMVEPSLNDLVTELGPDLGMPKFYTVTSDAPAMRGQRIHYTRVLRVVGQELPYWQRVSENLWGLSVLERLYDRLLSYDTATTGASQLVYKSHMRTLSIEGMREIISTGGSAVDALVRYTDMMRRFQGIEGLTMIDALDKFEVASSASAFSGLKDVLGQFGEQLAGALEMPLSRLFGQGASGLSGEDESGLRLYYDGINQKQNKYIVQVTRMYRAAAQSEGIKLPTGFKVKFRSLWQLTEVQKADIADKVGTVVEKMESAGIISKQTALKELRQNSEVTGIFTNITDEDIEAADSIPRTPEADGLLPDDLLSGEGSPDGGAADAGAPPRPEGGPKAAKTKDAGWKSVAFAKKMWGLDLVIENEAGTQRSGKNEFGQPFQATLAADYGYIQRKKGADGDEIDVFVCRQPQADANVYIIDNRNLRTGMFDEHKVMLGYPDREAALRDFEDSYPDGRHAQRIGSVSDASQVGFAAWLVSHPKLSTPYSGFFQSGVPAIA